jgi:hypothetical protein
VVTEPAPAGSDDAETTETETDHRSDR